MANGEKKRLLVVDDEKAIRQLLARIAQRAGFEVDTANDGIEALEKLEQREYAIAIIDLMMPRLSGYELVQKISMLNPRPVVLVATAMANGDVASLDDSMVRRVIKKPFDINAVARALVETALQIAKNQEAEDDTVAVAPPEVAKIPVADAPPEQPAVSMQGEDEEKPPAIEEPPPTGRH
ncbi:MAG TPA: response regulator [Thermoanaerobaculia bacterium]|nr:response regulator [Thermoanaerobaculia bacterium]